MKSHLLLWIISLLPLSPIIAQRSNSISGCVTDSLSGERLEGAHVYISQLRHGETTDKNGLYRLVVSHEREIELRISYVGYTPRRFSLRLTNDTILNVSLKQENHLSDINVYGSRQDFGIDASQMSAIKFPIEEVYRIPMLFGEADLMKALQKLPGVQSGNEGQSGIYVRGGGYDQNQITMDGATLYNAEHLKGFVSAINADAVEEMVFYKGAFPARYGGQLSSIVDIGMKSGDINRYHGEINVGVLSSKVHLEGPLWKGKTSFNIAARASYFDWVVQPVLERIVENKKNVSSFANINYYDVSAKLTHRFSPMHNLSGFLYIGKDINNQAPSDSEKEIHNKDYNTHETVVSTEKRRSGTDNNWGNIVSSIKWMYRPNEKWTANANISFSTYHYSLKQYSNVYERSELIKNSGESVLQRLYDNKSYTDYRSNITDLNGGVNFSFLPSELHRIRFGGKVGIQTFHPQIRIFQDKYLEREVTVSGKPETDVFRENTDTLSGKGKERLSSIALYAEDDWNINKHWSANIGLRYSLFYADKKAYHSLEPRISLSWLLKKDMSLKVSYAHMAQGIHLLNSTNIVSPSDIWVPISQKVPLMRSDQMAIGYNYEFCKGVHLNIEGYYKYMNNLLEYQEGASYTDALQQKWDSKVALGKGESYGVEFYLQKDIGKTTGWISYTWSKTRRLFNRSTQELNGGKWFYAANDRRHNVQIVLSHRFNKHWNVSLSWEYLSGRRGTLATTTNLSGLLDEYYKYIVTYEDNRVYSSDVDPQRDSVDPKHSFIRFHVPVSSYKERNGYMLPATHRLDAGVTYTLTHKRCESSFNLSVYNLYNHRNISNVYWGYHQNQKVLKGVCLLPIMPSVNYSIKF